MTVHRTVLVVAAALSIGLGAVLTGPNAPSSPAADQPDPVAGRDAELWSPALGSPFAPSCVDIAFAVEQFRHLAPATAEVFLPGPGHQHILETCADGRVLLLTVPAPTRTSVG